MAARRRGRLPANPVEKDHDRVAHGGLSALAVRARISPRRSGGRDLNIETGHTTKAPVEPIEARNFKRASVSDGTSDKMDSVNDVLVEPLEDHRRRCCSDGRSVPGAGIPRPLPKDRHKWRSTSL